MLKNPSYSGITTEFWNSCDAICSRDYWTLWGTPNCGKGQPQQTMGTGHGASPARFRKIRVGMAFAKWKTSSAVPVIVILSPLRLGRDESLCEASCEHRRTKKSP